MVIKSEFTAALNINVEVQLSLNARENEGLLTKRHTRALVQSRTLERVKVAATSVQTV